MPCPGPYWGGGMEPEPKGSKRPRRAALTCQHINTPLSSRLFTQTRCSGDGSSLSKRRAAPLGKQLGVYLNVKQESCSLDLQPLPQPAAEPGARRAGAGWMGPWSLTPPGAPQAGGTRGEWVLPVVGGRGPQGRAAPAASVASPDISISAGFAFAAGKVPRWEGPAPLAAPTASSENPDRGQGGPRLPPPRGQDTQPQPAAPLGPPGWHPCPRSTRGPCSWWHHGSASSRGDKGRSLPRSAPPSPSPDPQLPPLVSPALR